MNTKHIYWLTFFFIGPFYYNPKPALSTWCILQCR